MKKISKNILAIAVVLFSAFSANGVKADEITNEFKWGATQPITTKTSEGVDVVFDYLGRGNEVFVIDGKEVSKYFETFSVVYAIGEDYEGESLIINPNLLESIIAAYSNYGFDNSFLAMPGDNYRINVTIINNSKYQYNYDENSFVVYPDSETEEYYSFEKEETIVNKEVTPDDTLFNGEAGTVMNQYVRPCNEALVSLINNDKTIKDIKDETLDTLLKNKKNLNGEFYKGIDDLGNYYLDYYNTLNGTNNIRLEDFTEKEIIQIMENKKKYSSQYETNASLIALHFNYFYNVGVAVGTGDTDEMLITDKNTTENSVGEYMRNENKGDQYVQENFGTLESGSENAGTFTVHLNGAGLTNVYQNYDFDFHTHMSFTAAKGNLVVEYVDVLGNKLTEDLLSSEMVGKDYSTSALEFDKYKLVSIKGEEKGKYVDGTTTVTYIYEPEAEEVVAITAIPKTGVNADGNLYGLLVSVSLGLALLSLKKVIFN